MMGAGLHQCGNWTEEYAIREATDVARPSSSVVVLVVLLGPLSRQVLYNFVETSNYLCSLGFHRYLVHRSYIRSFLRVGI